MFRPNTTASQSLKFKLVRRISVLSMAAEWPHSYRVPNLSLHSVSVAFSSSFATFLPIQAPAGLPPSAEQITHDGSWRLRHFKFLLFIIEKQTTFKLLRLEPSSASKLPKSVPLPLWNLCSPTVPGWPPSPKSGCSSNLGLMECVELKTRQLQWKKLKSCVLYGSDVPKGGRGLD